MDVNQELRYCENVKKTCIKVGGGGGGGAVKMH